MYQRALKAEFLCCGKNLLLLLCITFGMGLLGVIISTIIALTENGFYPAVGVALALAGGIMACMFTIAGMFSSGFDTAIKMGCTRRTYFAAQYTFSLGLILFAALSAALFALLEYGCMRLFFPIQNTLAASIDELNGFQIIGFIPWYVWLILPFALLIMGSFTGALFLRFGKAAFWVIYFLCIAPALLGDPISEIIAAGNKSTFLGNIIVTIAEWFAAIPQWLWIAFLCLLPVALLVYTVISLMRQPIKA